MAPKKIGIVGCGAIGSVLAKAISSGKVLGARVAGLNDLNIEKAKNLANQLQPRPRVKELTELVASSDLVVEAAQVEAVPDIAKVVLQQQKALLVLSVSSLVIYPKLLDSFRKKKCLLHFPSGAIAGLDALKAAAMSGNIQQVSLNTCKTPKSLSGAPYIAKQSIDISKIKKVTTIFQGSAREAINSFPANVNVAAAVSLLGLGPDKTVVQIVADPKTEYNSHTLNVKGMFGEFTTITKNIPSQENSKTSYLAALSALALLVHLLRGEQTGT